MAEYIKTLKEDNGDITYPVTQAGAVLLSGGGDLETTLNNKASQTSVAGKIDIGDVQSTDIVANAVTTAKIADEAVTETKIDWSNINYLRTANGFTVENASNIAGWEIYIYAELAGANSSAGSIAISAGGGNNYFIRDTSAGTSTANLGEFFQATSSNVIPFLRGVNSNLAGPMEIFLRIRKSGSAINFFDIRCDSVLLTTSNGLKSEIEGRMGIPSDIDADFTITITKGTSTIGTLKALITPIYLS